MVILKSMPIFGYESKQVHYPHTDWATSNKEKLKTSLIACLPIGNLHIGATLIKKAKDNQDVLTAKQMVQLVVRGVLSILCPPLVILIDLFATAIFHIKSAHEKNFQPHPQQSLEHHSGTIDMSKVDIY